MNAARQGTWGGRSKPQWGYVPAFPQSALTVSGTAARLGLRNTPTGAAATNLSKLSDFLGKLVNMGLPIDASDVTSAYRSDEVNAAVGGATHSAHKDGDAVDLVVPGWSNVQAATWLYERRGRLPELDQVIWYTDTGHLHIAIGGSRRAQFLRGTKEGGSYVAWKPGEGGSISGSEGSSGSGGMVGLGAVALAGALAVALLLWRSRR